MPQPGENMTFRVATGAMENHSALPRENHSMHPLHEPTGNNLIITMNIFPSRHISRGNHNILCRHGGQNILRCHGPRGAMNIHSMPPRAGHKTLRVATMTMETFRIAEGTPIQACAGNNKHLSTLPRVAGKT